jgi:hypothetical protein
MKEAKHTQSASLDDGNLYRKDAIPLYSDEAGRLFRDKALTQATDLKIVRTPRRGAQIYWVMPVPESDRVRALRRDLVESPSARLRELATSEWVDPDGRPKTITERDFLEDPACAKRLLDLPVSPKEQQTLAATG